MPTVATPRDRAKEEPMNPRSLCAALAALLVPLTIAHADDVTARRETASGATGFTIAGAARTPVAGFLTELSAVAATPFHGSDVEGTRYESARYRPRRERYGYRDYGYRRPR